MEKKKDLGKKFVQTAVKQNELYVGHSTFSVMTLLNYPILMLYISIYPMKIIFLSPKLQAVKGSVKQKTTKEIMLFLFS